MARIASTAAIPSDLKLGNRMQVLEIFKRGGDHTANDVSDAVGLSRQTVMKAIQFFMERGIIVSAGKDASSVAGGKRPELFSLTPFKYLLCVELWPGNLNFVLLDLRCNVIDRFLLQQSLSPDIRNVMEQVGRISGDLLQHNRVAKEDLLGVSVSTSGIVNYAEGSIRYSSISPDWGTDIPIRRYLQPYFGPDTAIIVENVGKMVARPYLHEKEFLSKRVVTLFTAWGLSGCFLEKGNLLNGKNALIGEIGHMVLAPGDPDCCGCGSHGCFERLVSVERLRRNAADLKSRYPDSVLSAVALDELTPQALFSFSERGDAFARALVSDLARYFAMALRNISLVFDQEVVIFQGDYAAADPYFDTELKRFLSEFQYYPSSTPFGLRYDRRPIREMDLRGSYIILLDKLFSDRSVFE